MTVKKTGGSTAPQAPQAEPKKSDSPSKQTTPKDSKIVKNNPQATKSAVKQSFGDIPKNGGKSSGTAPTQPKTLTPDQPSTSKLVTQPSPGPTGDAKTSNAAPGNPAPTNAPDAQSKQSGYTPVKDGKGQQVKDQQGQDVVNDHATGANVALDPATRKPAVDPKTKAPVALDGKGQPTDAPKSIPANDKIETNDVNSPNYPKYFKDPAGDVHYYRKDNSEIKSDDPDNPVARLEDKTGKVHYYDTKTGQEITHPKDHRLPDNLPGDGPNALKEPPPPPEASSSEGS
jgi:hypothetical protein